MEYYRTAHPEKFQRHDQQAEAEAGQVFRVAFMARSRLRAIVNVQDVVEVRGARRVPAQGGVGWSEARHGM